MTEEYHIQGIEAMFLKQYNLGGTYNSIEEMKEAGFVLIKDGNNSKERHWGLYSKPIQSYRIDILDFSKK